MKRRTFLKAAGLSLILPGLESLGQVNGALKTKRLLTIVNHLGFYQPALIPTEKVKKPALLNELKAHCDNLKLFSEMDNPGVQMNNGHTPCVGVLSGYFNKLQRKNRISIDQKAAELLGTKTRYSSLCLQAGNNLNFSQVCWDKHGLPVHQISSAKQAFNLLFGVDENSKRQKQILAEDKSILDLVYKQAGSMTAKMNQRDKEKVDEYFTSVREVEKEIKRKEYWSTRPKPKADYKFKTPAPHSLEDHVRIMLDLAVLAFQSDSTRVATIQIPFWESFTHDDLAGSYHDITHHGQKKEKIDKLLKIEKKLLKQFSNALSKMKTVQCDNGTLFEETTTLITSPMGSSSAHNFNDLPAMYFNSDVKEFSSMKGGHRPICDLYLSILQDLGVQLESFGEGKKTLALI